MEKLCGFFQRFYMLGGEIHVFVKGRCVSSCQGECLPPSSCTLGLVTIFTYIVHIFDIYMMMYVFLHLSLHVLLLFYLYTHVSYYLYAIYYLCFTQRCLDEFYLKCFKNTNCQSLLAINSLLAKFFKSLCQDRFYCIQQVSMS